MMKKIITSSAAPAPIGPYNQAVLSGNTLYLSGQIAIDPKNNELQTGSPEKETVQIMKNIEAVLKEAGMTFDHVVKCSIFLTNLSNFSKVNAVYGRYFDAKTAPARETVGAAQLPKGAGVEISAIAIK